jgi:hypothetical protein
MGNIGVLCAPAGKLAPAPLPDGSVDVPALELHAAIANIAAIGIAR